MQLVDLSDSHLSGKMRDIPENIVDLEVDWEIDPDALTILEKIGVCSAQIQLKCPTFKTTFIR